MDTPLKNPLYGLLIADDPQMRLNLITGVKKISIREGHRDFQKGPILIGDPNSTSNDPQSTFLVQADITEVKRVLLSEVTQEEWEADGFVSQENMLSEMRKYYKNISLDSPVTVLRWENVRGYWTTPDGIALFKDMNFEN